MPEKASNKTQNAQISVRDMQKTVARRQRNVLPEEAFSRIAEAPLLRNNSVRLLRDATENYPAWLSAIEAAERYIHFESYIVHEDEQGRIFSDALIKKASEGVKVRLVYDWLGGLGNTSKQFWQRLRDGGVEVRCYNPFSFIHPLGWINRDHRKILVVDGKVAFVTGLCVGQMWVGENGEEPWRDTGVEIRGPAVRQIEDGFIDIWDDLGPGPTGDPGESTAHSGDVNVRVVASKPGHARTYRIDQMIGALSRETLWLTDAYFAGSMSYIETLRSAALDGVDVRMLLPASTDIPIMQAISRSGYRSLLESGVRIYEWNGPMVHAKTAVVDGYWSRVGSTNLNVASWLTNCELDVLIENEDFGRQMQEMFVKDLDNATEIILNEKRRPRPEVNRPKRKKRSKTSSSATARFAPSAIAIGSALGSSISNTRKRYLGATEAKLLGVIGLALLVVGVLGFLFPRILAVPLGIILIWISISLFVTAYGYWRSEVQPGSVNIQPDDK
jgi:cardiolipin synthase